MEKYSHKFDSKYNTKTMLWTEKKCNDINCQFCSNRPDTVPNNINELEKEALKENYEII